MSGRNKGKLPLDKIDYPAHLKMMWDRAMAVREANAPTVISSFAGCGGSLTGYMMAGYRDLLAIDWNGNSVATLLQNYPDLDIFHGDIAKLSVADILKRTGLQPGQLDVFDGSPPCQGFSTAGKRMMDDPRNQLFREYVRLLRGLQPRAFVMENVKGLILGKMRLVFTQILRELKNSGYKVSACLLNSMYFHVPQMRERIIFLGVREDLCIEPSHPRPESVPISVRDAWRGVAIEPPPRLPPSLIPVVPHVLPYDGLVLGNKVKETPRNGFTLTRLCWHRPANTIITRSCLIHPSEDRMITIPETKRCQSIPDEYQLVGSHRQNITRIGNSVPPLLMEAIARHVRVEILNKRAGNPTV